MGPNLGVFPLEQTCHVRAAKSERPRLTNGEIIVKEFQPMSSQFTNVTDGRTDGQTDRQTTCDRNTALCTKVHRAVKTEIHQMWWKQNSEKVIRSLSVNSETQLAARITAFVTYGHETSRHVTDKN